MQLGITKFNCLFTVVQPLAQSTSNVFSKCFNRLLNVLKEFAQRTSVKIFIHPQGLLGSDMNDYTWSSHAVIGIALRYQSPVIQSFRSWRNLVDERWIIFNQSPNRQAANKLHHLPNNCNLTACHTSHYSHCACWQTFFYPYTRDDWSPLKTLKKAHCYETSVVMLAPQ